MRRRWRRVREVLPIAVAYAMALLFVIGLLVDRRPPAGPAVPAMSGLPEPGDAPASRHTGDGGGGPTAGSRPPLWLQLLRPDAAMARRLLEQAIPLLEAYGSPRLVLYGDAGPATPPAGVFQDMFPFLRGRAAAPLRLWALPSRGHERELPPGSRPPGPRSLPPGPDPVPAPTPNPAPDRTSDPALDPAPDRAPRPPRGPVAGRTCGSSVAPVAGGQPLVGIYHTHDYESYISEFPRWQDRPPAEWGPVESHNPAHSIIRVGARLAEALCERGVTVVHSPARHALTYLGAYLESQKTVQKILKEYPTVQVLIDVHRDSGVGRKTAAVEVAGLPVARPMFVVGQGRPGDPQPLYGKNLAWAKAVHAELERRYPALSRGVLSKPYWYNQNFRPGALLIEIGSIDNTMDEALATADLLAGVLADLIRGEQYPQAAGTGR